MTIRTRKGNRIIGILLAFVMVLSTLAGVFPLTGLTADAANDYSSLLPASGDNDSALQAKQVTFNEMQWYVIEDNSTSANEGLLTLLSVNSIGTSEYNSDITNGQYSNSTIKTYLDSLTESGGSFYDVKDAIKTVSVKGGVRDDSDSDVEAKLYLLNVNEALYMYNMLSQAILILSGDDKGWWLRGTTSGIGYSPYNEYNGSYVTHTGNPTSSDSSPKKVNDELYVRPALQLDLSKVTYDSVNKTFTPAAEEFTSIYMDGATLKKGDATWNPNNELLKLSEGSYKLTSDIKTSYTIYVEGNVTLDLNGFGIIHNNALRGAVVTVGQNASLTVDDSNGAGSTHYYYIDDVNKIGKVCDSPTSEYESATKKGTFEGGYITGGYTNSSSYAGSGIRIFQGTLTLNGGTIIGNNAKDYYGGGIYNSGGVLHFTGGNIIGNFGKSGGGIYCVGTNENEMGNHNNTMTGGVVKYNYCGDYGAGVDVLTYCPFTMSGGTIEYNGDEATKSGGGVYCYGNSVFTMSGGTVKNNTANYNGGGINVYFDSTLQLSGDVEIKDNSVIDGSVHNICLYENCFITITGQLNNTTPIGVGLSDSRTGVFTNTAQENVNYNNVNNFKAEGNFLVQKNANSQLELAEKPEATVIQMDGETLKKGNDNWTVTNNVLELSAGDYKLGSNIKTTAPISVTGTATLDLNGYGILQSRHGHTNMKVIKINNGAHLILSDTGADNIYYITISDWQASEVNTSGTESDIDVMTGNGTVKVTGGYITGGDTYQQGGGVYIDTNGTFDMTGGTIVGNRAREENTSCGGGVYNLGTFNMSNDAVIKNNAVIGSSFVCGGGIENRGSFNMSGNAIIENNYSRASGGGVSNSNSGTTVMSDNAIITNNKAISGGGVVNKSSATFTMNGGKITNNKATSIYVDANLQGGGVYNADSTFIVTGCPFIYGNEKNGEQNNFYVWQQPITVNSQLDQNAKIGVNKTHPGTFTKGGFDNTTNKNVFISDSDEYRVEVITEQYDNGQLKLTSGLPVKYFANGATSGSVPVDSNSPYYANAEVTVLGNTGNLIKPGYNFVGWNTASDGSGQDYAEGAKFTITGRTNLYAKWVSAMSDDQKPHAKANLTYTGQPQELVTAPSVNYPGYTIQYKIGENDWSTTIPKENNAGNYVVKVKYVNNNDPSDELIGEDVNVSIAKAEPTGYVIPTGLTAHYGETLANVLFADNHWQWKEPSTSVGAVGNHEFTAVYTPDDTNNYNKAEKAVSVEVLKAQAEISNPPTAIDNLVYTGSAQALVNAGSGETGGLLNYAIGNNDQTAPTGGWNAAVPTRTDAGTYYVWYKVAGDNEHSDSTPECITVTIDKMAAPQSIDANQKPTAKQNLVYTGNPQELITPPSDTIPNYTVEYSLDNTNWSTETPKGTDAANYQVKVRYKGDNNHQDFNGEDVNVSIAKGTKDPGTLTPANKPTPVGGGTVVKTGLDIPLVIAPTEKPDGFTQIEYSTDGNNWGTEIPTGTNVGTYTIHSKWVSDNWNDVVLDNVQVTIREPGAQDVINMINALPDKDDVTINDEDAINSAKGAYEQLDNEKKGQIPNDIKTKLDDDVTALNVIKNKIQDVINKITALPNPSDVQQSHANDIGAARTAYDDLTPAEQAKVTNYDKLESDETALSIVNLPDEEGITIDNKESIEKALDDYNNLSEEQKTAIGNTYKEKLDKAVIKLVMEEVTPKTGDEAVYRGNPIPLINEPTTNLPTGYSIKYAVTEEDTEPADGYTQDVPKAGGEGTYYVWYKVVNNNDDTVKGPNKTTVNVTRGTTPSPTPSPDPEPTPAPDEDYTVPIENKSTVDINTHISGGIATISDITSESIERATKDGGDTPSGSSEDRITIDISGANQTVTGIEIGKQSLDNLSNAVENNADINAVEIKLTNATVSLNATAIASITSQAQGDTIRLVVDSKNESSLNNAQRRALSAFSYRNPFEAYFESDGIRISDFGGGEATVSVKHDISSGQDVRYFHMYYVPENGILTAYTTWYENGMFSFITGHFSDYAIVYDETMRNDTLPEGFTRNLDGTLTVTDPELGTAIVAEEAIREGTIYRMYNPFTGEHIYTKNAAEVIGNERLGWNHEEDADFPTFGYDKDGSVPVYRLYNSVTGLHHYTTDREEAIWDINELGFDFEGIVFFALPGNDSEGSQIYRLYNPYDYQHLWTINTDEYEYRASVGWNKEGLAFNVQ